MASPVTDKADKVDSANDAHTISSKAVSGGRITDQRLAILSDTSARLLSGSDPDKAVLPPLYDDLSKLGVDMMLSYKVAGPDRLQLGYFGGIGEANATEIAQLEFGQLVSGEVARDRRTAHITDVQDLIHQRDRFFSKLGMSAYLCEPLMAGDQLLGTVSFGTRQRSRFDQDEIELFQDLARLISIARERSRTEAALKESEIRFGSLVSLLPAAMYTCDGQGRITFFNESAAAIWGRDPQIGVAEEQFFRSFKLFWPDSSPMPFADSPMARAVTTGMSCRAAEVTIERPDTTMASFLVNTNATTDDKGKPNGSINVFLDITERKAADKALAESEARFRDATEATSDWFWETDKNNRFYYFSEQFTKATGLAPKLLLGKRREDFVAEVAGDETIDSHLATLNARKPFREFTYALEPNNEKRFFSVSGKPVFDAEGTFRGYRGTGTDITERIEQEQKIQLLNQELSHRVKNSLATVQAIAEQMLSAETNLDEFRESFLGRLHAIAAVHELLFEEHATHADLSALVLQQVRPFAGKKIGRVRVNGPKLHLSPESAHAIGHVLHELATNAVKYGALSNETGRVEVSWERTRFNDRAMARVTWSEVAGPAVTNPNHSGFGRQLIEHSLPYTLGGHSELNFDASGLTAVITVPIDIDQTRN